MISAWEVEIGGKQNFKKLAEDSFQKLKIKQLNFLAGWMFPWAGHRLTHPKNPFKNMHASSYSLKIIMKMCNYKYSTK